MALSRRSRRFWSLVILCLGLPVYIFLAVTLVGLLDRPPVLIEFAIYAFLGIAWALPFRFVFRGIASPGDGKQD